MSVVDDSFDREAPDWILGGGAQRPLVGVALFEVGQQQVVAAAAIQFQKAVRHLRKQTLEIEKNRYKTKTDLDTHFTKHTGDKQYTCPTCGKSYRFWNGLDNCLRKHEVRMR